MAITLVNSFHRGGATSGNYLLWTMGAGNLFVAVAMAFNDAMRWQSTNFANTDLDGSMTEVPFWNLQSGSAWDWGNIAGTFSSAAILYQISSGGQPTFNYNTNHNVQEFWFYEFSGVTS